jgi:hypothetical protein
MDQIMVIVQGRKIFKDHFLRFLWFIACARTVLYIFLLVVFALGAQKTYVARSIPADVQFLSAMGAWDIVLLIVLNVILGIAFGALILFTILKVHTNIASRRKRFTLWLMFYIALLPSWVVLYGELVYFSRLLFYLCTFISLLVGYCFVKRAIIKTAELKPVRNEDTSCQLFSSAQQQAEKRS